MMADDKGMTATIALRQTIGDEVLNLNAMWNAAEGDDALIRLIQVTLANFRAERANQLALRS